MSLVFEISHFAATPLREVYKMADDADNALPAENGLEDDESINDCLRTVISRFLLVAQIIASIIALPIILAVGLLESLYRLCTGDPKIALATLRSTMTTFTSHIIWILPASLLGIFVPQSTFMDINESLVKAADKVSKTIWMCDCSSEPDDAGGLGDRNAQPLST